MRLSCGRARERQDRELRIYDEVDDRYNEYQKLCLAYPYLDVADIPSGNPATLDPLQARQELMMLSILFALFERAYVLHLAADSEVTRSQWRGLDRYIRSYLARPNIQAGWRATGVSYDPRFIA